MIPRDLILQTGKVLLRPLKENDFKSFLQLAQDEGMWNYFSMNLADGTELKRWMEMAMEDMVADSRRAFTIVDKSTGNITGSTSMGNISTHDLKLEIGWSWLGAGFRSSGINRHAKFAMMQYAFEEINFERVEFKTDVLNERARQGLRKIGGVEEGILRSHMTMWNNRRRSSIYYSVLKNEWPEIKEKIFRDIYEVD